MDYALFLVIVILSQMSRVLASLLPVCMTSLGNPPLEDCWTVVRSMDYAPNANPEAVYHSNPLVVDLPQEHMYRVPRLYSYGQYGDTPSEFLARFADLHLGKCAVGINMIAETEVDVTRVNFPRASAGLLIRMCSTALGGPLVSLRGGKSTQGKLVWE
ncbi:MAG: hypothetical protein M1812_002717 [Candelaria pacifica]|nr:MAG: hypothetical protein M1812_002717 [Candelaria pacifica]